MSEVRRENPEANWGNLLTGIIILVLIAVASVWYFGEESADRGGLLSEIFNGSGESTVVEDEDSDLVTVQAGEGLWHVAERVCGDAELYNHVAAENGMTIWSRVYEGQELTVTCDYETEAVQ